MTVAAIGCGSVAAKHDGGGTGGAGDGAARADGAAASDGAVPGDGAVNADAARDGGPTDAGDAGTGAACILTSPFGTATLVAGLNSTSREDGLSLTADRLIAFISSFRGGTGTADHIYTAARAMPDQAFGTPTLVASIMGSTGFEFAPRITADGLRLYFASNRSGASHIYLATRTSLLTDFAAPGQLAIINSSANDFDEHLTGDEQTMVFASNRTGGPGGSDLYVSQRSVAGFGVPALIPELSSASAEFLPVVSDDRLTLYFASDRTDAAGKGGAEIWVGRRSTATGTFTAPQLVAELNSPLEDYPLWLSADGCTLYFASGPATALDLFQATRGH